MGIEPRARNCNIRVRPTVKFSPSFEADRSRSCAFLAEAVLVRLVLCVRG